MYCINVICYAMLILCNSPSVEVEEIKNIYMYLSSAELHELYMLTNSCIKADKNTLASRKHAYIMLTPLNPTFI